MTLREQFEKETTWIDKKEQPMFASVKYIHWLENKVKNPQKNILSDFEQYWNEYGELHASMCGGDIKQFAKEIWASATTHNSN